MEKPTKIEFNVDEQYENEKGIFTVISIHRDQMVIRWESGEEISTDVALQTRIAERRQWEKLNREAQAEAAKAARKSKANRKKAEFTGFAPTDFKKGAAGTTWRSRNQLGKALIQHVDTVRFKLNSWAFGRKAEMHIQDAKHHDQSTSDHQARFFVRVDPQALHYGFRVSRPEGSDEVSGDWVAFCDWLAEPENEHTVQALVAEFKLAISNQLAPAAGKLVAADDGWQTEKGTEKKDVKTLLTHINNAPPTSAFDMEIGTSVAKSDAVESGIEIAIQIARLFTNLLPLYQAAVLR